MVAQAKQRTRILIVGGGFGGVYTARCLERLLRRRSDIEVTLVNRDNFFLMTPLLFEAWSGTLELRHCSMPIRDFLRRARFIEATVSDIDLDRRLVLARAADGPDYKLPYDQLVLAMGACTNMRVIPGSDYAFTFRTVADAIILRNHVIERFERADAEIDPGRKSRLLTFVVIGGGLVGTELFGELTAFADEVVRFYPHIRREDVRFFLFQRSSRLIPEVDPRLADYATRVLKERIGAVIRTRTGVCAIEPGKVHLEDETIEADTIVLAAGIVPNLGIAKLDLEKDYCGHVAVDACMRTSRTGVWALGDCATIPDPEGKPYPKLAQHALREAEVLAANLSASLSGGELKPFVYETMGIMASLGHDQGLGRVLFLRLRGFVAWWVRRTYYLAQMPRWNRRVRIILDWTLALFFRPDIVKVDLASESALLCRDGPAGMEESKQHSDSRMFPPAFETTRA